jgi:hypothetical protein
MVKRHHRSCSHAKYRMTCEQYDDLWEEVAGHCQICGQLYRYAPGGRLHIDHDKRLGYWAVRGLVCLTCNHNLGYRDRGEDGYGVTGPEIDRYLSNPWHRRLPGSDGVRPEPHEDLPRLDPATAMELLCATAKESDDARRRNLRDYPEYRRALLAMIRWAHQSGVRQVDMIRVAGYGLTQALIYVALHERIQQPAFPQRSGDPDECTDCQHSAKAHQGPSGSCRGRRVYDTPHGQAWEPCACDRYVVAELITEG